MADTIEQECNCCEFLSDCINGLCQSCSNYNYELQKDLAHETDMAAQAHVGCMQLETENKRLKEYIHGAIETSKNELEEEYNRGVKDGLNQAADIVKNC